MHNHDAIDQTTGEAKKSEIITFYNLTKEAADVVDQISAAYSTARMSKRWQMVLFFTLLNTAAINARVLLQYSKYPFLQQRKRSQFLSCNRFAERLYSGEVPCLPRHLQEKLSSKSKEPTAKKQEVIERKRCYVWPSSKNRKSKLSCTKRERNVCGDYSVLTCTNCT
ncbi:uncharacterized protein LOC118182724 [Stegodyphus dumicola]|uniref:uncharacterized protein LOC118182724 n=1 Tax=Stegodyphus dumicola TaxID=202533 RepID=UPI0015A79F89|nr:uncharacterized protein LOC118182724 [Stegodyphus dumicola]